MIDNSKSPFAWLLNSKAWQFITGLFTKSEPKAPRAPKVSKTKNEGFVAWLLKAPGRLLRWILNAIWWLIKAAFGCGCIIIVLIPMLIVVAIIGGPIAWITLLFILAVSTVLWIFRRIYVAIKKSWEHKHPDEAKNLKSQRVFNVLMGFLVIFLFCGTGGLIIPVVIASWFLYVLIRAIISWFTHEKLSKKDYD